MFLCRQKREGYKIWYMFEISRMNKSFVRTSNFNDVDYLK